MGELFDVGARLVIDAVDVSVGNQFAKIFVSFVVLGDDAFVVNLVFWEILGRGDVVFRDVADVVGPLAFTLGSLVLLVVVDVVEFAANEGFDFRFAAGAVEVDRPEKIAVVGHRQSGHAELFGSCCGSGRLGATVEQRVVGVIVKMDERTGLGHR